MENKIIENKKQKTALRSNGVYSVMNDTWIKEPIAEDIPEVDKEAFEKELKVWEDRAKELLDDFKENLDESLTESKETDILKARSIIADQIRGEWDADKGYTKAAADLAELKDIDTKEAQDMMLDIASEEHVHVGELETAYDAFDPKLFDELEDGHNEADEKAEPANALDYDIKDEPIADGLDIEEDYKKGVNNKTLKDVMMSVANSIVPEQILPDTTYDVHHLDYDNTNNEIYNISIMPAKLHNSFHVKARYLNQQEKDNLFKNTPEYHENCIEIGNLILSFIEQQGPNAELAESCLKTMKETLKESDYLEDEEECAWCHERFPKSELEVEKDFGQLCHKCIRAIKSHEGEDSLEFEEALTEEVNNEKVQKIDDFMERLYDMRKKAISEDGEYSIGNLVFKELRSKGYLDKLRDLKAEEVDKELSLESLDEAKNNNKNKKEALPSVLKDVSVIDVTAKSPLWTVVVSPDFLKMYNDFTKPDKEKTVKILNNNIPGIKINGTWPLKTDPLEAHHYPIIELKLGTNPTGQPIRILYFTKHINNTRYMIFGAILIHTEPNLSKKERELSDKSYELFLN